MRQLRVLRRWRVALPVVVAFSFVPFAAGAQPNPSSPSSTTTVPGLDKSPSTPLTVPPITRPLSTEQMGVPAPVPTVGLTPSTGAPTPSATAPVPPAPPSHDNVVRIYPPSDGLTTHTIVGDCSPPYSCGGIGDRVASPATGVPTSRP